jgi:hypothetical protein
VLAHHTITLDQHARGQRGDDVGAFSACGCSGGKLSAPLVGQRLHLAEQCAGEGARVEASLRRLARGFPHPNSAHGIGDQFVEPLREVSVILWRDAVTIYAVGDDLTRAADVGEDDRQSRRHRLDRGDTVTIREGGQRKEVAVMIELDQAGIVGLQIGVDMQPWRRAGVGRCARDDVQVAASLAVRQKPLEHLWAALAREVAADEEDTRQGAWRRQQRRTSASRRRIAYLGYLAAFDADTRNMTPPACNYPTWTRARRVR